MELLRYQTRLDILFSHLNKNKYTPPPEEIVAKLERLMPLDMYLYTYAKQLFEHRWQWYVENVKGEGRRNSSTKVSLKLPKVIDGCVSGYKYLKCPGEEEWFEPDVKQGNI